MTANWQRRGAMQLAQAWKTFLADTVQRQPGRVAALSIGAPVLVVGVILLAVDPDDHLQAGGAILLAGAVLTAIGCYRVRRVKVPFGEFETESTGDFAAPLSEPDEPTNGIVVPRTVSDEEDVEPAARFYIADRAIKALLKPTEGPLAGCTLRLFMYDDQVDRLLPIFDPDQPDADHPAESWAPGLGATGTAFLRSEYVLAEGPEAWDETYGLTPLQQDRYSGLTAVASAPVLNIEGSVLAVLSATTEDDDPELATEDGQAALLALATGIARILVDVLKWFPDREPRPQ